MAFSVIWLAPRLSEAYYLLPPASHASTPASRAFLDGLMDELSGEPRT